MNANALDPRPRLRHARRHALGLRAVALLAGLCVLGLPPYPLEACDLPVCTAGSPQFPVMVADVAGGAFVVWRDTRDAITNGDDIYLQRLSSGMTISPGWPANGVAVVAMPATQGGYQVIPDGTGGAIIVWQDRRDVLANGVDIYAQRVTADGSIAPGWPVNGLPLCTAPGWQIRPALALDGAGGAIVVWEDYRSGAATGSEIGDIYATRVTANGTLAPGWVPDGNPVSTAPNHQGDPVVLADGEGGGIIAWADAPLENFPRGVRALRLTAAGAVAPGWPTGGVTLSAGPRPQGGGKKIVSDGAGGAIVAWLDLRNDPFGTSNGDLFAQRVRADGTIAPGWPADGAALCQAPDLQQSMDMVTDGAGGAVIVWEDYRSNESDVYGQRVTASGSIAPGWLTDGNPLGTGPGYQLNPRAAFDGLGGVTLAFAELVPGGTYDLRAQRILLDGSFPPGWSLTPRPLCIGNVHDYQPTVASDGAGGLIVASQHDLHPNYDLYATWVPGGPVATVVALASVEVTPERVVLTWHGAESAGFPARVERWSGAGEWQQVAILSADGGGVFRFEDREVRPGERYGYRLAYRTETGEATTAEEWVTVPVPRFALSGAQPNPVVDELVVGFSLPSAEPARIEVFDLAGRQVLAREVGSLGIGTHRVNLGAGRGLPAGVYHLVLSQADRRAVARAVVSR